VLPWGVPWLVSLSRPILTCSPRFRRSVPSRIRMSRRRITPPTLMRRRPPDRHCSRTIIRPI